MRTSTLQKRSSYLRKVLLGERSLDTVIVDSPFLPDAVLERMREAGEQLVLKIDEDAFALLSPEQKADIIVKLSHLPQCESDYDLQRRLTSPLLDLCDEAPEIAIAAAFRVSERILRRVSSQLSRLGVSLRNAKLLAYLLSRGMLSLSWELPASAILRAPHPDWQKEETLGRRLMKKLPPEEITRILDDEEDRRFATEIEEELSKLTEDQE